MATIPVVVTAPFHEFVPTGPTGWRLIRAPFAPNPEALVCQPLTGGYFGWISPFETRTSEGMSISPSSEPTLTVGAFPPEYYPATMSYPGDESVLLDGTWCSSATFATHQAGRFNQVLGGIIIGYTNLDVSVDDPLSPDAEVTLTAKYFNYDEIINDQVYWRWFDKIQIVAGGTVYTKNYAELTDVDVEIQGPGNIKNVLTGNIDTLKIKKYESQAVFQFPLSAENISIRAGTPYDTWQPWIPLKWVPGGNFELVADEDELTLDARGVYVVGGHIREGDGLRYTFSESNIEQPYSTDVPYTEYDVSGAGLDDGDSVTAYLQATSQAGCTSNFNSTAIVESSSERIGAMSDHDGVSFAALRTDDGIEVRKYTRGTPTEETTFTLPGYDRPFIYGFRETSEIFLWARNKETKAFELRRSDNYAAGFTYMATAPFNTETHQKPVPCALNDGGHGLAAIEKDTDNIHFVRSWDGEDWTPLALVANVPGVKGIFPYQESPSDSDRLAITIATADGVLLKGSDELGAEGSWKNYEELDS